MLKTESYEEFLMYSDDFVQRIDSWAVCDAFCANLKQTKKYKSELNYVSENYIQSELREFEMQSEYYYKSADEKGLKKIKPNAYSVAKEFKNVTDLSKVVTADDFSVNQEAAFIKAFSYFIAS